MTLIDHFNIFQRVSEHKGLSASARSLYFSILAEFNRQQYPETLKITTMRLQDMSGIKSSSTLMSARNALINLGAIKYHACFYTLTTETLAETLSSYGEIIPKTFKGVFTLEDYRRKNKNKYKDAGAIGVNENGLTSGGGGYGTVDIC